MSEVLKQGIVDRSVSYSLRIIKFCRELEKDGAGRILGRQLARKDTYRILLTAKKAARAARREQP